MRFKQQIKSNMLAFLSWKTKRHIVVIESDDWGTIRMPSRKVYDHLIKSGVTLGKYGYEKVDTIASREDLELLFDTCESIRDSNNRPLVITANAVMANPDFERIEQSGFSKYCYEPITATMDRYYPNESPLPIWKEGIERGVFYPQLHGREHVNVPMWMNSLQQNHPGARESFKHGVFSFVVDKSFDARKKNTASFNYSNREELLVCQQSIREAAKMFEELFGFKSESFIAPSYCWDPDIEKTLNEVGVKYIQGGCRLGRHDSIRFNTIGKRNALGQIYLNRNAAFEYSQDQSFDWTNDCLEQMEVAFRYHVPVTISAHRLNFIGAIDKDNRDENLKRLKTLFDEISRRWPDVEFMTSDELGRLIESMRYAKS